MATIIEQCEKLFYNGRCTVCPIHEMNNQGIRIRKGNISFCKIVNDRCYVRATSTPKGRKKRLAEGKEPYESRVGLSYEFKKFGINVDNVGRHHMHLFMYYPNLNFSIPAVPSFDCLGKFNSDLVDKRMIHDVRKRWRKLNWSLHHINVNPFDDRKENLCLTINTEHSVIHWLYKTGDFDEAKRLMNSISDRNYHLFGEHCCPREYEDIQRILNG